jgi:hypothetical protein
MENLSVKKVVIGIVVLVIVSFAVIFLTGVVQGFTEAVNK